MYARVTFVQVAVEDVEEAVRLFDGSVIPAARQGLEDRSERYQDPALVELGEGEVEGPRNRETEGRHGPGTGFGRQLDRHDRARLEADLRRQPGAENRTDSRALRP